MLPPCSDSRMRLCVRTRVCVCVCVYCLPDSAAEESYRSRPESSGLSFSYLRAAPLKLTLEKKRRDIDSLRLLFKLQLHP